MHAGRVLTCRACKRACAVVLSCREDVREAREFLDAVGLQNCRVLAKIETRQSLLNFRGILTYADGIIVSRCADYWGGRPVVRRFCSRGRDVDSCSALDKVAVREEVVPSGLLETSALMCTDTVRNHLHHFPKPALAPYFGLVRACGVL